MNSGGKETEKIQFLPKPSHREGGQWESRGKTEGLEAGKANVLPPNPPDFKQQAP